MISFIFKLLLLSLLIPASLQAETCKGLKEDIPVLAGGRVKPLYVLAKESNKYLTGKSKYKDQAVTETFCHILMSVNNEDFQFPILVEHVKLKEFLNIEDSAKSVNALEVLPKADLIRSEIIGQKENNSYKKALNKLRNQINTFKNIRNANALRVYMPQSEKNNEMKWVSISELLPENFTVSDVLKLTVQSKENYKKDHSDDYLLELTYVQSNIYSYTMLLCIIGIFLTVLLKNLTPAVVTSIIILIVETVAITWRVLISGRAPITNMYETVMFSGYGALFIALCVLYFRRDKIYLLGGLGYNILCLFMMTFANNMLSSSISPLVPVLRDNFWLSTHVTTIILSYAALALSWMVANITIIKLRFSTLSKKDYRYYQDLTYNCIKIGIILLAAGIILGGVWADYSWGRFWGWDPKETWSLIVLLFYMVLVHGKYSSWINTHRFMILSAAGYMTVMMAWFGVNYILASGLHSYGFSEGGAVFLGSFFLIQTIIIIVCSFKVNYKDA